MSQEQYQNAPLGAAGNTTVASGGYTSGSGVLNVASTSSTLFPSTAPFRVVIQDQNTRYPKAILKVTAINSGTQFAVSAENDGTCVAGDLVFHMLTAGAMDQIKADVLPRRVTLWMDEATILSGGGSIATEIVAGQIYGGDSYVTTGTNGDSLTWDFVISPGTYTISALGSTNPNRGKLDWYIDGTLVASGQDWYTSGTGQNVVKTVTGVTISSGYHVFKIVVNGKNASASSFVVVLNKVWIKPASD